MFKTNNKLTFFYIIETKPVEIVFDETADNIKEVNQNYITL